MDPVSAEPVVVPVPVPEERDGQSVDAQADWRHRYPHLLLHPPLSLELLSYFLFLLFLQYIR